MANQFPVFEKYIVERILGEGGMATVFFARRRKDRQAVAIKVLKPKHTSHHWRFTREAQIMERLGQSKTPYVVHILDRGLSVDGQLPFIVMDYI
jgi:serine/threonine protein kinase